VFRIDEQWFRSQGLGFRVGNCDIELRILTSPPSGMSHIARTKRRVPSKEVTAFGAQSWLRSAAAGYKPTWFGIWGLESTTHDSRFRSQDYGSGPVPRSRDMGWGCEVEDSKYRFFCVFQRGLGLKDQNSGFRVYDFRVSGFGSEIEGRGLRLVVCEVEARRKTHH